MIAAAVMLITMTASAQDLTILCSAKPQQTSTTYVTVPAGDMMVEVVGAQDSNISCQYLNQDGQVGLDRQHTNHCSGTLATKEPTKLTVQVTNHQKMDIDYRILVHNNSNTGK